MREIINGIFYIMRAGCPWRLDALAHPSREDVEVVLREEIYEALEELFNSDAIVEKAREK